MALDKVINVSPPIPVQSSVSAHEGLVGFVDPRYGNAEFRWAQAERYCTGKDVQLSLSDLVLIRFFCDRELSQIQEKEKTKVMSAIERIADPFFSLFPSDLWETARFNGVNVMTIASLLISAYTGDTRFIIVALIGYAVFLGREIYLKNFSSKGV